ncbi:MAG: hypothetical protein L3J16_04475, partial [Anaerolineales bacterium]|nr:hypothetical protein [Anaerolineales bacterium]
AWLPLRKWKRVVVLTASGVIGGVLIPWWINIATSTQNTLFVTKTFEQPLLWYRLLPNDTYRLGILPGIIIATAPLFFVFLNRKWLLSLWQKIGIIISLLAFFIVGLVASTKIGGGNNLHNLDMFLIALVFVAAIAWKSNKRLAFGERDQISMPVYYSLLALVIIPVIPHFLSIYPRIKASPDNIIQLEILTDFVPYVSEPLPLLPSDEQIEFAMQVINEQIRLAIKKGDILFIDQRQLLTFGNVPRIPLVPEYEKKLMMDKALAGDARYFQSYYRDLSEARFSLIVTEPLKIAYKGDQEGVFGEENDAWTKWVAEPTLCFYESIITLKDVYIQLLVPREDVSTCSGYLR